MAIISLHFAKLNNIFTTFCAGIVYMVKVRHENNFLPSTLCQDCNLFKLLEPRSLCRNVSVALILVRMVSVFIKPVKDGHLNKETCVSFLSHSVCPWMGVIFHSDTSPSGRVYSKCIPGLIGRTLTSA